MPADAIVHLMYHELALPGRALCQPDAGYARYVVGAADFRQHLVALKGEGLAGVGVGRALGADGGAVRGAGRRVAITFDDGCETDLTEAAPALTLAGFGATFYVVSGFVGRRGYLAPRQVRELAEAGFEVGSHSVSHRLLTGLTDEEVRHELAESKDQLEQWAGRPVEHFSCPGGRWDARVAAAARQACYRSVATSRVGANGRGADPFRLARVAVRRGATERSVVRAARGEGLWAQRARALALDFAKGLLGDAVYQKIHAGLGARAE
jgi:peptidoglycan/xylan/chitin deacetylase (PgdA/CDA1 family)